MPVFPLGKPRSLSHSPFVITAKVTLRASPSSEGGVQGQKKEGPQPKCRLFCTFKSCSPDFPSIPQALQFPFHDSLFRLRWPELVSKNLN